MTRHYSAEAKAIFKCLMLLPHHSYLELDLTLDQVRYWLGNKSIMLGVAWCWQSLHTGEEVDLSLFPDDYHRQKIWLCTLYWQRHWEMIIACFPKLRQIAGWLKLEFPFSAPVELFVYILGQEINADFAICLQPYVEISSPKAEKMLRHIAKNPSLSELGQQYDTPVGRKKLEQMDKEAGAWLRQAGESSFWTRFTLLFSQILGQSSDDAFIKSTVAGYNQALADLAKLDAKKRHTTPSTCWHNGVKKRGKQGGGYS